MSQAAGSARERFERFVRWTIEKEYGPIQKRLPDGEREAFADYYKKLPKPGDEAAIARYLRGFWRSEAGWTARWIGERATQIGVRERIDLQHDEAALGRTRALLSRERAILRSIVPSEKRTRAWPRAPLRYARWRWMWRRRSPIGSGLSRTSAHPASRQVRRVFASS